MPKFWMNISTTAHWNGPPVGIVRVEQEFRSRLNANYFISTVTGFNEWNEPQGIIGIPNTELSNKNYEFHSKANSFVLSARMLSKSVRIQRALGYLYSSFYTSRPKVNQTLEAILYKSFMFFLKLDKVMFSKLRVKNPAPKKMASTYFAREIKGSEIDHPFSPGDTLFTCGLDWDNKILEKVHRIKKEISLNVVTVVYDLIPLLHPEFIQNQRHVNRLLGHFTTLAEISSLVIVNTNVTKKNFENFCENIGVITPKIFVMPWGASFSSEIEPFEIGEIGEKWVDEGFLLCVGTVEIRKNYPLILNMIRLSLEKGISIPNFVIVGAAGWGADDVIRQMKNDEYLQEKLTWLEGISDAELIWLYKNCEAFLSTSFHEGFGLPVSEAESYAKNIFLSDIPVYRELFPDSFFISPNDPALWVEALSTNLLGSKTAKNPPSWNDSVECFVEEVNRVLGCNLESKLNDL